VVRVSDPRTGFLEAATWHGSLDRAEAILQAHPELATSDLHTAAVLGDDAAVRGFIAQDPGSVTTKSPPYGGDALNYLCLSKYLRLDPTRSDAFLRAAAALLDAGADPNTGFWTTGRFPERETALYGAAGVAHHAALTRLLVERGADPRDEEAVYHSPEGEDLGAMKVLVESGKLTEDDLALMLIRKHDWHDLEGVKYLLSLGIDLNRTRERGTRALHHAIARDNDLRVIELLLDHGADPMVVDEGLSAAARAARRGRGDILQAFERRNLPVAYHGVERLIAACARGDQHRARTMSSAEPRLLQALLADGPPLLSEFAGCWNTDGVRILLDLGVPVAAPYRGDGYFDIAPGSTALHVAAWNLRADLVQLLLERGAPVNAKDGKDRTPLMLAVKACVNSYWMERRTPEPARLLLEAGASVDGIQVPSGYDNVDALLRRYGKSRA
jgi:ankyrin repeat protein